MFPKLHPPPARVDYDDGLIQLSLCRAHASDATDLVEAIVDSLPALRAFMPWAHLPDNNTVVAQTDRLTHLEASWDAKKDFVWHLFEPQAGGGRRLVGCVGMHPRCLNPLGLEVGYWIRTDAAGRGLCTLATKLSLLTGFQHMGLERMQVGCDENNSGSRRVIEKVGVPFEGSMSKMLATMSAQARTQGWAGSGDMRMYALTDDDFPSLSWIDAVAAHTVFTQG